ncbi:SNP47-like protein [Mya arenaria]|uniref:Synaptosomal-associated protein 47 n=1 Tax=Mya arenaria TaxID=6604 RepID=A0ABY7D7F9_MYAAR|nr:synaptosomal-associated protein 47-like [Mya arenaria]WAQ93597.1 SNP47-like protein [Mya arenaria]
MMSRQHVTIPTPVYECMGAVYSDLDRRWVNGMFSVSASSLQLDPYNKPRESPVYVSFWEIKDVRKATTGLIFGAILVTTVHDRKVWFSSFVDRECAFRTIEHFRKGYLLADESAKESRQPSASERTKVGQKLLSIVHDSQTTLTTAAEQLHAQGRQMDSMMTAMSDLHGDLDIANRLVGDLDSWVGRWRIPRNVEQIDPVFVNKSGVPEIFEYEVLYNKEETNRANSRQLGTLRLSNDGITILNSKMKTEHHFMWSDVSQIRVITPWEIKITRTHIGRPDLAYSATSAQMMAVLKILDGCARYKMKFDKLPDHVQGFNARMKSEERFTASFSNAQKPAERATDLKDVSPIQIDQSEQSQLQINQSKQVVTDSEADEISRALSGLKSLALSVQEEGACQNEKLDSLNASVESANQRLEKSTKKIKKLT